MAFDLSQGSYKLRVDYLGYQFWSDAISVPQTLSATVTIPHQDVKIRVNQVYQTQDHTPRECESLPLYSRRFLFEQVRRYDSRLGRWRSVCPKRATRQESDYLGSQYWSQVFTWQDQDVNINHGKSGSSCDLERSECCECARISLHGNGILSQ